MAAELAELYSYSEGTDLQVGRHLQHIFFLLLAFFHHWQCKLHLMVSLFNRMHALWYLRVRPIRVF